MRKQFILEEDEYLAFGNSLEQLDTEIGSLHNKLRKDDEEMRKQLYRMSKNIRMLLYDFEWIE